MSNIYYWEKLTFSRFDCVSCHVTHAFQSESTLYSYLSVKELCARSRREIWSLRDCNRTRTHSHLVHKWSLNHLTELASLAKCLSVRLWTKWLWVRVQLQSLKLFKTCWTSKFFGKKIRINAIALKSKM